jgi:hypothetical protein
MADVEWDDVVAAAAFVASFATACGHAALLRRRSRDIEG